MAGMAADPTPTLRPASAPAPEAAGAWAARHALGLAALVVGAVGASRPARTLRALVLALFRDSTAHGDVADETTAALAALPDDIRRQASGLVSRLLARSPEHNLSRWAQSLGRTADRFGLLVCGDIPVALGLADAADGDLAAFAASTEFRKLRQALGITADANRAL